MIIMKELLLFPVTSASRELVDSSLGFKSLYKEFYDRKPAKCIDSGLKYLIITFMLVFLCWSIHPSVCIGKQKGEKKVW